MKPFLHDTAAETVRSKYHDGFPDEILDDDDPETDKSRVRYLPNKDIVIPFSCCWILKKIENFRPENGSFDVTMTMILLLKFTGLPNIEKVMDLCRAKEEPEFE